MRRSMWSARSASAVGSQGPRNSRAAIDQILRQQWHRAAGRETFATFVPCGACDVQMRPAAAVDETRQEAAGRDRTGVLAADVGDIGEAGLELLLVFVPE